MIHHHAVSRGTVLRIGVLRLFENKCHLGVFLVLVLLLEPDSQSLNSTLETTKEFGRNHRITTIK